MNRRDLLASSAVTTATVTRAKLSTGEELREAADEIAATAPTTWIVVSKAIADGECITVPPGPDGREYLWISPAGYERLKRENADAPPATRLVLNEAHTPGAAWGVPIYLIDGQTSERATMMRRAFAEHVRKPSNG